MEDADRNAALNYNFTQKSEHEACPAPFLALAVPFYFMLSG